MNNSIGGSSLALYPVGSDLFRKMRSRWLDKVFVRYALLLVTSLLALSFVIHRPTNHSPTTSANRTNGEVFASHNPALLIDEVVVHGRIIEIKGRTDAGNTVMINGQIAAVIFSGNSFRHFLGPFYSGLHIVTVTAQNVDGGFTMKQLAITVE